MYPVEKCYQDPDRNLKDVMFEPPTRVWSPKPKENGTKLLFSSDSDSSNTESNSSSESESEQHRSMDLSIKVVEHPVLDTRLVQDRKGKMEKLNNNKRSHIKSLFSSHSDGESSKEVMKTHRRNKYRQVRQTQKQMPGERRTQEDKQTAETEY